MNDRLTGDANARWIPSWRFVRHSILVLLALSLVSVGACGGKRQVDLSFMSEQTQTIWVVVAVLTDPDALNGYKTAEIFQNKDDLRQLSPAVHGAVPVSVPPSGVDLREIPTAGITTERAWVVAIGNLPGDAQCTRKSLEIKARSHLTLTVGLRNDCVELSAK